MKILSNDRHDPQLLLNNHTELCSFVDASLINS